MKTNVVLADKERKWMFLWPASFNWNSFFQPLEDDICILLKHDSFRVVKLWSFFALRFGKMSILNLFALWRLLHRIDWIMMVWPNFDIQESINYSSEECSGSDNEFSTKQQKLWPKYFRVPLNKLEAPNASFCTFHQRGLPFITVH